MNVKNCFFLEIPEYKSFEFTTKFKIQEVDFSVLIIEMKRKEIMGDSVIAQTAIAVKLMREGIRAIQMYDKNGEIIENCALLC